MRHKEQMISLKRIIQNNWFLLRIALTEAPVYTIHILMNWVLHRTIVFVEHIYMIGFIIDCIQYQRPFSHVLVFVGSVFSFVVLVYFWRGFVTSNLQPKAVEKINKRIRLELYTKASIIDLECYDNPGFYNDFIWAMSDATNRAAKVLESADHLFGSIAGILIAGAYLLTQDKIGMLFALTAFVSVIIVGSKLSKLNFKLDVDLKPLQRKRDYINRVLYLSDYAKEIRLSRVKAKLYKDFAASAGELEKSVKKHSKKLVIFRFLQNFVCNTFIFDGLYVIYLMFMTIVKKVFSYGTMVTLYRSCEYMKNCLMQFAKALPEFQEHSLYIEKLRSFLDYTVKVTSCANPVDMPKSTEMLQLRNVAFSYVNGGEPVLKNINLTIGKGEKVAIVGYNGSGKTTLVKTIMRLYDVTEGEILYNGVNIKNYDLEQYRSGFAAVFQDYQLFAATLGENIAMDNSDIDEEKALKAIRQSGFEEKFSHLEKRLNTALTKEFDESGVNLSGGESQKVSISRSIYKESQIIILDEPSSALDPISEYNLNNTMLNLESDKTVIFISHRLSTTRMADVIYMFENGEIIESGNHDQLMALNGKYAEMFLLQSEKYR